MKRFRSAAGVALAVVGVLTLAGPAAAADPVPFKGSLDGDVTHAPVDARTDAVLVEAAGTATHLGRFEVSVPHLVDLPTRTAAGTYEFTAANGDKVYATFTGQASPTATPGVLHIVETATITGGTGRLAGAAGGFVVDRLYDRIGGTTLGTFEGTISLGVGP
jgi:hypothetical protein